MSPQMMATVLRLTGQAKDQKEALGMVKVFRANQRSERKAAGKPKGIMRKVKK